MSPPPSPHHIALLLKCPVCRNKLVAPTTLRCGHTICSAHHSDRCPVDPCSHPPETQPSSSRVAYFPAPHSHTTSAPTALRVDVSINKILALLDTHSPPSTSNTRPRDSPDSSPSLRPRKRRRQLSPDDNDDASVSDDGDDDDDDDDLLSHLRRQSQHQRLTRPDEPLAPDRFEKDLLSELTCEICFMLFYQPTTTPCQHTFCAKCLHRSLDHSTSCPLCRQDLPGFSYFQDHPHNQLLLAIILKAFPDIYTERHDAIESEERDARLDTPIFVCQLSFPGTPTLLHFFEPRYRLMLRRCLEQPNPRFGMIMPPKAGAPSPHVDYGTMLEIRSVQMLPDGRSMVETWGTHRFRILERGTLDGYMVGRIERIDDYEDDITDPTPQRPLNNAELMAACRSFLDRLERGTAPWVVQRLSSTYGVMPTDPSSFSFWVALVLPIDEYEKGKLLPIRSPRLRLLLVVHWIEQLNSNWYAFFGLLGRALGRSRARVEFAFLIMMLMGFFFLRYLGDFLAARWRITGGSRVDA
ncbi:PUA-like domain-containing protein [Infundibulicybe gibba]|nr:PUA-like domain-containing protein [Infundibulicybe gibba]